MTRPALLETRGLSKSFGAVVSAADINVSIVLNSVVGLIGTNGAGKTTFLNMVTGYLKPSGGQILYDGRDITGLGPRAMARLGICRSFQIPQVFDTLSVEENLLAAAGVVARNAGNGWINWRDKIIPALHKPAGAVAEDVLQRFGLAVDRNKIARQLPQGLRKLLDIAMALIATPRLLLLDEPTSGVSAEEKFAVVEMVMQAVRGDAVAVLFVEHDMDIVARFAQRVLAFYDGRVLKDGTPDVVLSDAEVSRYVTGRIG